MKVSQITQKTNQRWTIIVPKIKSMLKPGGNFLKVYMSYMKEEQITQDSNALVKKINGSWNGASASIKEKYRFSK